CPTRCARGEGRPNADSRAARIPQSDLARAQTRIVAAESVVSRRTLRGFQEGRLVALEPTSLPESKAYLHATSRRITPPHPMGSRIRQGTVHAWLLRSREPRREARPVQGDHAGSRCRKLLIR